MIFSLLFVSGRGLVEGVFNCSIICFLVSLSNAILFCVLNSKSFWVCSELFLARNISEKCTLGSGIRESVGTENVYGHVFTQC